MTGFQVFRATLIVLATVAAAYMFLLTINVWIVLFIAILIASAVRPAIMKLKSLGLSQSLSILIVYGGLAIIVATLLLLVLPPVINQFAGYLQNDDRLANRLIIARSWIERFLTDVRGEPVDIGLPAEEIREAVAEFINNIRVTAPDLLDDIGGFVGDFVLIIVMGIYWVTSRERAETFLISLIPLSRQQQARAMVDEIEIGQGAYVRGLVLVSSICGLLAFIALFLLRVPNAATISFLYALATSVPIIGGFIGVALATVLALLSSPGSALTVLIVTVLLQQFENYVLSPRIMAASTDFDEILVIVFIALGFALNGVTGALIAIPLARTFAILAKHLILEPRKAKVIPVRMEGGILLQQTLNDPPATDVS